MCPYQTATSPYQVLLNTLTYMLDWASKALANKYAFQQNGYFMIIASYYIIQTFSLFTIIIKDYHKKMKEIDQRTSFLWTCSKM